MDTVAKDLDAETLDVLKRIPDADFIHIGREMMIYRGAPSFQWCITFRLPRRNKALRVMGDGRTTMINVNGETIEEAKDSAVREAHYYRTGTFPTEEG